MQHTESTINTLEREFYGEYLNKAIAMVKQTKEAPDGVLFRSITAAAGVIAKQRQTRGAMKALDHQIKRDTVLYPALKGPTQ